MENNCDNNIAYSAYHHCDLSKLLALVIPQITISKKISRRTKTNRANNRKCKIKNIIIYERKNKNIKIFRK